MQGLELVGLGGFRLPLLARYVSNVLVGAGGGGGKGGWLLGN